MKVGCGFLPRGIWALASRSFFRHRQTELIQNSSIWFRDEIRVDMMGLDQECIPRNDRHVSRLGSRQSFDALQFQLHMVFRTVSEKLDPQKSMHPWVFDSHVSNLLIFFCSGCSNRT
jgi:hypothetical protein